MALGAAGSAALHRDARAQTGGLAPPKQPRGCSFPSPWPRCSSFFITEAGLAVVARYHDDTDTGTGAFWDLGWKMNRSDRSAIGGSIVLAGDQDRVRYAFKLRQRWWLAEAIAVDLSPGIGFDRITDGATEPTSIAARA